MVIRKPNSYLLLAAALLALPFANVEGSAAQDSTSPPLPIGSLSRFSSSTQAAPAVTACPRECLK